MRGYGQKIHNLLMQIKGLEGRASANDFSTGASTQRVRGVILQNVNTAAFTTTDTGAGQSGLTYQKGDTVLLAYQTVPAQNGVYAVAGGATSVLTRVPGMATGQSIVPGATVIVGPEPTLGKNTTWIATAPPTAIVGGVVQGLYGTNDPQFVAKGGNWATIYNTVPAGQTGGGTPFFLAGLKLTARSSGIFMVDVDFSWADATGVATTVQVVACQAPAATATVLAGAGAVLSGQFGVNALIGATGFSGQALVAAAGTAVSFNGAAFTTAALVAKTDARTTAAAGGTGFNNFTFHGLIDGVVGSGSPPTKTPYALNTSVAFGLSIQTAASVMTYGNLTFSARELDVG